MCRSLARFQLRSVSEPLRRRCHAICLTCASSTDGLLDSDIDYIRKSCVLRWVELAADVSAYNVAAALSQPFERVRLLLGHYKTNSAPYVPSRRPHNWGLQ